MSGAHEQDEALDAPVLDVAELDVVVIGAGIAGLYLAYRLGALGVRFRVLEAGDGVGGTWYWNRYPGARCDVESLEYSYSFSEELEREWAWSELMPSQPEIERYLNFVADRFDLRRHVQLGTRVAALTYDEAGACWTVDTERGGRLRARYVVAATGCLSAPLTPNIPGLDAFRGVSLYTSRYPAEGFDFSGRRVAVIGTGSSGVQAIPVVAEQAGHLWVLQRSAAYTRPAGNRPLAAAELERLKADYPALRARQRRAPFGLLRFGGSSLERDDAPTERILDAPEEERRRKLAELGWAAPFDWVDVMADMDANRAAMDLYADLVRAAVHDPDTAESLVPRHPLGCKRPILDTGYYETFNRPNVTLVDLRHDPIERITERGIRTRERDLDVDVILYATGFDAMTGALDRIDVRGRGGRSLRDHWRSEGPVAYLGLQVAGFPNLFTVTGPGSPATLTNMYTAIEQHVEWITDCLAYLRDHGYRSIEASVEAQDAWVDEAARAAERQVVRTHPSCDSWFLGSNVAGKRRVFMPYAAGLPPYRARCDHVAANGYEGFALA